MSERPELPPWAVWKNLDRAVRVEAALTLLADAVIHEAREKPFSERVKQGLAVAKEALEASP